jgi:uncharacterized protein YaaQ
MTEKQTLHSGKVDQLVLIAVPDEQAGELGKKLSTEGFRFTLISASNGFLPTGITCLMLGIFSDDNDNLLRLVEQICKTKRRYIPAASHFGMGEGMPITMIEAEIGSTLIYVIPVESFDIF